MKEDPYRRIAKWYDKIFESMNSGLRLLGLRLFIPKSDMSILDIGCGTGVHLDLYRRYHCKLHGIDASPSMLDLARQRLGDEADLRLGNASTMPYGDRSFDLVTSMLALHEMNHPTRIAVIDEMKRVLKDNGRILLIDFHPGPIQPFQGWLTKMIILISEFAAGGEHFKNYRHFISIKGLPALIDASSLNVEKERIVSGGALALFLLRKQPPARENTMPES